MRSIRRCLAAFAVAALVAAPAYAVNSQHIDRVESSFADPMLDALVLRPVGLIGLMMSGALWVPAELMTVAVNPTQWKLPVDHLLISPARFVFVDPIGTH